jgi:hypothetical protein
VAVKGSKLIPMRITPHNSAAKVMRSVALGALFAVCVAGSYFAGVYQTRQQHASQFNQQGAQQQKTVATLSQELAQLRISTDIDRQTIEELRQVVMTQKAQISASERDLLVYKDLLSPHAKTNPLGLSFGVFTVSPLKEVGHFNYSLTVQKLSTKETDFSGFLEFRIIGLQGDKSLQLSLYQVSSQVTVPSIPLNFKYFQKLEGDLTLPVNFVPQTVELVVKTKDNKPPPLVSAELDWPTADVKLKSSLNKSVPQSK